MKRKGTKRGIKTKLLRSKSYVLPANRKEKGTHMQTAEICQAGIFYQVLGMSFPGTEPTLGTVERTEMMLYLRQLCRMHVERLFKFLQGLLGFRELRKKKINGESVLIWEGAEPDFVIIVINAFWKQRWKFRAPTHFHSEQPLD